MAFGTVVALGSGFAGGLIREATETKTSTIGGKKIKEHPGKLSKDLGKPAFKATKGELDAYVNKAGSAAEKRKRVARVNLSSAHKKGHKAKGDKVATPKAGRVKHEAVQTSRLPVSEKKMGAPKVPTDKHMGAPKQSGHKGMGAPKAPAAKSMGAVKQPAQKSMGKPQVHAECSMAPRRGMSVVRRKHGAVKR